MNMLIADRRGETTSLALPVMLLALLQARRSTILRDVAPDQTNDEPILIDRSREDPERWDGLA